MTYPKGAGDNRQRLVGIQRPGSSQDAQLDGRKGDGQRVPGKGENSEEVAAVS
jgi:hypothetical protein